MKILTYLLNNFFPKFLLILFYIWFIYFSIIIKFSLLIYFFCIFYIFLLYSFFFCSRLSNSQIVALTRRTFLTMSPPSWRAIQRSATCRRPSLSRRKSRSWATRRRTWVAWPVARPSWSRASRRARAHSKRVCRKWSRPRSLRTS